MNCNVILFRPRKESKTKHLLGDAEKKKKKKKEDMNGEKLPFKSRSSRPTKA